MKKCLPLFLIFIIAQVSSHPACGHHLLKHDSQIVDQELDGTTIENLRMTDAPKVQFEPIRIRFDYSLISSNSTELKNMKMVLDNNVKFFFADLIKVKRQGSYKIESTCSDYQVPSKYTGGKYSAADLIILVRIENDTSSKIEAAASHCQQESVTKRAIVGHLTFRKELFDDKFDSVKNDYMTWLAIHELTHVLVFSEQLFRSWPVSFGKNGINAVIGKKTRPDGTEMKFLKTPKILELGKKHFSCPDFYGLPLEYNGEQGTSGSHWAKRYMNTDYMIGDSYGENLISPLTLAMFEDSQWYKPNYDLANLFLWGKSQGCDFLNPNIKCASPRNTGITSPFKNSYCTNPDQPVCSVGNVFRGNCKTKSENPNIIKESEKYFKNPNIGGEDILVDRCPIPIESKTKKNHYYGGSCRNGSTSNIKSFEKVCPSCACFTGTIVYNNFRKSLEENKSYAIPASGVLKKKKMTTIQQDEDEILETYCLEYRCNDNVNNQSPKLFVVILGKLNECPEGQTIELDGFYGKLVCPPASNICNKSYNCKFGCTNRYK